MTDKRKKRADAGRSALTRDEAALISATLREATRKNGKRLYSIADAVETLRANGFISAGRTDETTGEFFPLSEDAISRALRNYGLHPEQLDAPAPHTEVASLHPNHVWQIDASLCTLYYLSNGHKGLQVMDSAKFYKNKPANLARIASDRVWSYEITDHASGWIYVEYVTGAESGENLCSVLINAMQERGGADVLHGVPKILYLDPGSANTAGMTKNMCRSLGIDLIAHKPHNARATGQVEKARDIIERKLEPGLKFRPVHSLEELNALAAKWRSHFNATAVHSRHGKTRTDIWLKITAEQLKKAPSVEVCRELAVAAPELRKVTPKLRVSFRGTEFDVSTVPGVLVGEKLMITRNPWRSDVAQVVLTVRTVTRRSSRSKRSERTSLALLKARRYLAKVTKPCRKPRHRWRQKKPKRWLPVQTTPQMQPPHARRRRCRSAGGLTRINISTTPHFRPICRSVVRPLTYAGRALNNVP